MGYTWMFLLNTFGCLPVTLCLVQRKIFSYRKIILGENIFKFLVAFLKMLRNIGGDVNQQQLTVVSRWWQWPETGDIGG